MFFVFRFKISFILNKNDQLLLFFSDFFQCLKIHSRLWAECSWKQSYKHWIFSCFTDSIQPLCLPPEGQNFTAGRKCFIAGWGRDAEGETETLWGREINTLSHKHLYTLKNKRRTNIEIQTSQHISVSVSLFSTCLSLRFSPWRSPGGRGSSAASGSVSALVTWVQYHLKHVVCWIPWGWNWHLSGRCSLGLTLWPTTPQTRWSNFNPGH